MLIEGWGPLDSFFMTVITMTTIGYGEVNPLSETGRIFTIGLIVIGVITASFAVTTIIEVFTSKEFLMRIRNRRRRKALEQISNHCVICGFGRMGRSLASELQARGSAVVAIDPQDDAIERCQQLGVPAIQGNAANEGVLHQAGIERANSLVASTGSDAENVFIVLTAKSIRPDLQIISRCHVEDSIPKLAKAGADTVISPYTIAGRRIAHILTHPTVTSFLDGILDFGDHQMRLEEFIIGQNSSLAGLTLREAKLKVTVLAVNHPDQVVFAHPNADTKLLPGAEIIVMGLDQELNKLEQMVKG
jgi:voltage-gated potassium channel